MPWTVCRYQPDVDESLHVLTSTLPPRSYRDVPRFLRWTLRIRKQLADAEGAAGYSLDARLLRKTFYTLSAWSDAEAMTRFVRSGEHARMLADMAGRLGEPKFVESTATRAELPLDWDAAKQRLAKPQNGELRLVFPSASAVGLSQWANFDSERNGRPRPSVAGFASVRAGERPPSRNDLPPPRASGAERTRTGAAASA